MSFRPASELLADRRVRRGLTAQLAERERRLTAGERPLGWKLGFGALAAMERLGIAAPLIGFLTDRSPLDAARPVSLQGWSRPLLEPEIAVTLGSDLEPGSDRVAAAAALSMLGAASELADLDSETDDVERILAGNIFHRHLVLGPSRAAADVDLETLRGTVTTPAGEQEVADPQALTGDIVDLVRHVADVLGEIGLALAAGEVVICGSIVPPIAVERGDSVDYRLDPVGAIAIRFEDGAAGAGLP
jgi:2-keto-4-pentenoate hydratase